MNKIMPLIILMAIGLLLFLSWNNVSEFKGAKLKEYNSHIENAESLMSKEVYIDAVEEYQRALNLRPDQYDIAMKIVDLYETLDKPASAASALEKAIKADPTQKTPYIKLIDYYIENSMYNKAYKVLNDACEKLGNDSDLSERLVTVMSDFTLSSVPHTQVKRLNYDEDSTTGYMVVSKDGKYGLANSSLSIKYDCEYEDIGILSNKLIPVKKNGEYYYIDDEGYRKLVPDEPAEYFGNFGNGFAPACFGGKYGYINNKLKQYHFEYDYAGSFAKKAAAVQQSGKWAVINTSFEKITEFIFDEIVMDEYSYCSKYGVFFAKQNGSYALYDLKGNKLSQDFDEVRPFVSDQPAAVKVGGKWGFVSKEGKMVVEPAYDGADSFAFGYGPVLQDGKWGCINLDGNMVIEPQFDYLEAFMGNGSALSRTEDVESYVVVRSLE